MTEAEQLWMKGDILVTLAPELQPEKVTMRLDTAALQWLGVIYPGTEQADWPGTYDTEQGRWRFQTGSESFWFQAEALDTLRELPYSWYRDDLLTARSLGAISFLTERQKEDINSIWPNRFSQITATRQDLACLISAVTEAEDLWPILTLEPPPDTQNEAALRLYSFRILNGIDEQGSFGGEMPLTRGQAAAVFARVLRPELRQRPAIKPHTVEDLSSILVSHSSFGFVDTEYKIDLEQGLLWSFSANPWQGEQERDPEGEHQGFQNSRPLDGQKLARFRGDPALQGLLSWSGAYAGPYLDGHQWQITLQFSDGETRNLLGSNAYPEEWNALYDALYTLTGENILQLKSDWLDWTEDTNYEEADNS